MISTIVKIRNMRSSYRSQRQFSLARLADAFAHRVRTAARVGGAESGSKLPHSTEVCHRRVWSAAACRRFQRNVTTRILLRGTGGGWRAEAIEGSREIVSDGGRVPPLDVGPLQHEGDFAVAHQGDRRRRWAIARKITSRAFGGFRILPGEDSYQNFRARRTRDRSGNRRTSSRSAE